MSADPQHRCYPPVWDTQAARVRPGDVMGPNIRIKPEGEMLAHVFHTVVLRCCWAAEI